MVRGIAGGEPGGILTLLALIEEHHDPLVYDWRSRFGLSLRDVFTGAVEWPEAIALTKELCRDSSSHTCASLGEWDYPISRESLILADLADLFIQANSDRKKGNPKPYPRPFEVDGQGQRSRKPLVSQDVIRAALAARGHQ